MDGRVYHFSEEPSIERFVPHVPPTNPTQPPSVWAIDAAHAPLYWFPRECPRVAAYVSERSDRAAFRKAFVTAADRVHAIESSWLATMRAAQLYRYEFATDVFAPWPDAPGQFVAHSDIEPLSVEPVGDLLELHAEAGIDLRVVPSLVALRELAIDDRWEFSIVRWHNAVA